MRLFKIPLLLVFWQLYIYLFVSPLEIWGTLSRYFISFRSFIMGERSDPCKIPSSSSYTLF